MNCDNGSNVKKGLRSLSELAVTVNEEPLVVVEDNWSKYAVNKARAETAQDNAPAPVINPIEDVFLVGWRNLTGMLTLRRRTQKS